MTLFKGFRAFNNLCTVVVMVLVVAAVKVFSFDNVGLLSFHL